jgi:hypothetical protein
MPDGVDRVTMSRGLALLFGAGATLVAITLGLPHHHGEARPGLLIPVGLAYVVVVLLLVAPQRWPPQALSLTLGFGSALIALCVHFGGPAGAVYAFMYVWVALYAAAFFSRWVTLGHLAWALAAYAVVLATGHDVRPPSAQWLMAAGTSAVAAALILGLTRELRARARDLGAVTAIANEIGSASEVSGERIARAVCVGVLHSTGSASVSLLEELNDGSGLRVVGTAGEAAAGAAFDEPEGVAVLDRAYRTGAAAELSAGVSGYVEPVWHDGRVSGLLVVAWGHPQRLNTRIRESVALFAAEGGVALQRIAHQSRDRERRALALNDEIVQGLVVAKYALRGGRLEVGERAVEETLDRARALVEQQLKDLHGGRAPEPGSLRVGGRPRDAAS